METNKYFWNQTLKFSWGHIIAFVALVFMSYIMYMGDFYQNGGDFVSSAIKVGIIDLALLLTFIGAQIVKGTDEKFQRSIIIERILIILCPVVFIFAMFPYNHFWSVFDQRQQIEMHFNSAINGAKQMFVSYDKYAEERIDLYSRNLDSILIAKANGDIYLYNKAGFTGTNDYLKKQNYVYTLNLQLRSQNTDSLRRVAINWIDAANKGASVWNAFLVGNIAEISAAIKKWHQILQAYSEPKISNETLKGNIVLTFDEDGKSIASATDEINFLRSIYIETSGIKFNSVWTGIITFVMLLFPYFLQRRNTRAEGLYFLIPRITTKSGSGDLQKLNRSHDFPESKSEDKVASLKQNTTTADKDIFGGTF